MVSRKIAGLRRVLGCALGAALALGPIPPISAAAAPASPAHRFNQALALWRANRPDAATAELRQLADALPYETAFALGVIEARRGDADAARSAFARALRARENDPAALLNLAWCNGRLRAGAPGAGENPAHGVITLSPEQARRLLATAAPSRRNRVERPQEARW